MNVTKDAAPPIAVAALVLVVMAVHATTFRNLLAVGEVQAEVTHRVFALPVFLVLLWQSRGSLEWGNACPSKVGIALLTTLGLLWAVGELTFIRALSEVAAIAMIPAAVLAMFGLNWLFVLLFPLCFLLFAVPLRGPLVDWQVALTADFVHFALRVSGVPVHRDGAFFELPGRSWSVADECSGVEYFSACLMFATLFAWTFYVSNRKRTWFVVGATFVGIVGNWFRAYLTMSLSHFSGNKLFAEGHGTFGWVFFAILLFLYCWFGWQFRDPAAVQSPVLRSWGAIRVVRTPWKIGVSVSVALAGLLLWPIAIAAMAPNGSAQIGIVEAPERLQEWQRVSDKSCPWAPKLSNPAWFRGYCYAKPDSVAPIHLAIGGFAQQSWNAKLVTSVHEIAPTGWSMAQRGNFVSKLGDFDINGRAAVVRKGGERFRVWQFYALHGDFTGSDLSAKWRQLVARLKGQPDRSYWIAFAVRADQGVENADQVLRAFMGDSGPLLAKSLFPKP